MRAFTFDEPNNSLEGLSSYFNKLVDGQSKKTADCLFIHSQPVAKGRNNRLTGAQSHFVPLIIALLSIPSCIMNSTLKDLLASHLHGYYQELSEKLPEGLRDSKVNEVESRILYGTAGFRGNATTIRPLFYNVGLIGAIRCLSVKDRNIGIMVTASHNPVVDNGIKFIDSNGEMLDSSWEPTVEDFCNTHDPDELLSKLNELIISYNIDTTTKSKGRVLLGMDTRPSSEALVNLIKRGLDSLSSLVGYIDYGLLTTPALHYLVAESNKNNLLEIPLQVYYDQLAIGLVDIFRIGKPLSLYKADELVVDCANGVGSETMQFLAKNKEFNQCLPVQLINTGDGILNRLCGADYVKTIQLPPSGATDTSKRYAALDGDADRVVYFFLEEEETNIPSKLSFKLKLLDGDKIMALYAIFFKDILEKTKLNEDLSLGIIQTAYANGASTDYMKNELKLQVDFADTGVKNLHKKALDYDVGIYFEANGHGTILLSSRARSAFQASDNDDLRKLLPIINNYTGDAISDILVVETILRYYDWNVKHWYTLYVDRPNVLSKVQIKDRNCIKTTDAGRTCTQPEGLQEEIDNIVRKFGSNSRSFVRASGTEDVVRVYAESENQASTEELANLVMEIVKKFCA